MAKESQTTAVQVALRIRPLTERDRAQPRFANLAADDILKVHEKTVHVVPHNKLFTFDHVFGPNSQQSQIFAALGEKLVYKFVEGYNVTLLAYGQTSSGKTYTMGTAQHQPGRYNEEEEGIVPRAMALLFDTLQQQFSSDRPVTPAPSASSSTDTTSTRNRLRPPSRIATHTSNNQHQPSLSTSASASSLKPKYTVKVSFIEIYNEELNDLLNSAPPNERPPIHIREDAKGHIYWTGVKEVTVQSTEDVLYYLEQGTKNRATGATDMNEKSSRSHAIFSVSLKYEKWVPSVGSRSESPVPGSRRTRPPSALGTRAGQEDSEVIITSSKFHFVDLAGSERLKRTAAEGDRRKEGININAGLLALGNVISALGDPSKRNTHVPYRDSKLTRLLQDSLGGSATTLMIACVSPAEYNLSETLNTLQYANRARNIKNRIEKNEVEEWMTTDNIEVLRNMVSKLKSELRNARAGSTSTNSTAVNSRDDQDIGKLHDQQNGDFEQIFQEQRMIIADLQRQVEELDGEASVTRERNRVVEAELKRMRKLESMRKQESENLDFQHLVEPVIEEYEKSISSLESKLAMTRAALTHADAGIEEQRVKLEQYEAMLENQEHAMADLRSRLSKMMEREQSNEAYIDELEGKLMRSSNEAIRSQELLNELRSRISKFKETDENTEQYIFDLEQRLAASEADKATLQQTVDDLEAKQSEKDATIEKLRDQLAQVENVSTQKLMLKELDTMTDKYNILEKERDQLLKQVELLTQQQEQQKQKQRGAQKSSMGSNSAGAQTNDRPESAVDNNQDVTKRQKYHRSYAEEKETPASIAARAAEQAEQRAKQESERASRLQQQLRELETDHQDTLKELDEVLMRYQEALEQLDLLQKPDNLLDDRRSDVPALSQEMSRAKEEAINKERQANLEKIKQLEQHVNDLSGQLGQYLAQLESASKEAQQRVQDFEDRLTTVAQEKAAQKEHIQRLERELQASQDRVRILQEVADQHTAAEEIEKTLRELEIKDKTKDQEYQEEIRLVRAEKATLQQQYDRLEADYNQLLADQQQKDKDVVEQLDAVTKEKSKLEQELQQAAAVNSELENKVQELQALQQDKTAALAELKSQVLGLENALKEEKEAAQTQVASLKQENCRLAADATSLQSSLEELSRSLDEKDKEIAKMAASEKQLLQRVDDLDNETGRLSKELQQLQTLNASLESTLKASSTDDASRNEELERHIQKIAALETELQQKTLSLAGSMEEMNQYRSKVQEQIKQLEQQVELHSGESKELQSICSRTAELESQCKQQQATIENLQQELKKSKESHESADIQLKEKQKEMDQIMQELTQAKAQLEEFSSARKDQEQKLAALQQELEAMQDELENVLEEKHLAEKDGTETISALEAVTKENDELGAQLKETKQALVIAEADAARFKKQIEELTNSVEKSSLAQQQSTDEIGSLQKRLEEVEQLLQKMTQERNTLADTHLSKTTELARVAGALESEKQKNERLTKELAEARTSMQEGNKEMLKLEQKRRELSEALQDSKREIQELTSKVDQLEKHIQDIEQDLSAANGAVQEKDTHLRSLRSQIETHSRTINELRDKIEKSKFATSVSEANNDKEASKLYEERIAQLERKSKQLEDENLEYVTLSEEMENEVNRLMKELDNRTRDNEREAQEYLDTIHRLETQMADLTQDRDTQRQEVDRLSATLQELRSEYEKISSELQASMENAKAIETTSQELQKTIQELQAENADLRSTLGKPVQQNEQDQDIRAALEAAESSLKSQRNSMTQIESKLKSTEKALQDSKKRLEESVQAREQAEKTNIELKEQLGKLKDDMVKEKRSLETELAKEKKKKEKAEQALASLERQIEEMLSKKGKFMCF